MKTLFLQPFPSRTMPLADWFGRDIGRDILLLTPAKHASEFAGWAGEVVGFEQYTPQAEVDYTALRLARQHSVERIVAVGECDILRAAQLRRMLNLPGQTVESARAFRDKSVMKRTVSAGGVPVPEHAVATSALDVVEFAERVGFPIVGKPFAGLASVGTQIFRDSSELEGVLRRLTDVYGLVEGYVPGGMFHVDGLVHRGQTVLVSVSRYVNGMLAFQRGECCLSVQVDHDHPQRGRLVDFAERVLAAMPLPEATPFHLEVFHTPDDRLVFCEIASRVGGIRIGDAIERTYGLNLAKTWIELQLGIRAEVARPPSPRKVCGTAVVPPQAGRIEAFPRELDLPGIVDIHVECREGDVMAAADSSASAVAVILGEAESESALVDRLMSAVAAFQKGCRYGEAPASAQTAGR